MKSRRNRFGDLSPEEQDWIDGYIDGTIEVEAFEALQERMTSSASLRAVMRRYFAVDNALQNEGESAVEASSQQATAPWLEAAPSSAPPKPGRVLPFRSFVPMAAAAAMAFLLGIGFMIWQNGSGSAVNGEGGLAQDKDAFAEGFAVIGKLFDAEWSDPAFLRREGDLLGSEVFRLASGTAEIQFFSGATMTVEGPAEISLKSAWEASCLDGAVRMQVPPAARGFRLHAPETEIVDLGTEFGLVVRDGQGHVEVIDGEIALTHRGGEETILTKGKALGLASGGPATATATGQVRFPDASRFDSRAQDEKRQDFERWQAHRDALAGDDRLIAYYTFDREGGQVLIPNATEPRNAEFDGAIVLAEPVDGRWPGMKEALEFRRPGSRVRVNLPGEFPAFTFSAWVRIDSLDRWYNALFMGDGYENGEPHWQIRDDGVMMLSVMVDDTWTNPRDPQAAGRHRIYYSPPMWDRALSGQWMHLASVFDPEERYVAHYVNGEEISRETIPEEFFVDRLHIGNAEIGNWGEPHREDPEFAIRNLNGRMDELAIFGVALDREEIADLHHRSQARRD